MTRRSGQCTPPSQGSFMENLDSFLLGTPMGPNPAASSSASSSASSPPTTASDPDERNGKFSFGIEIEFAVAFLRVGERPQRSQDKNADNYQDTYGRLFRVPLTDDENTRWFNAGRANANQNVGVSKNDDGDGASVSDGGGAWSVWNQDDEHKVYDHVQKTINATLALLPNLSANRVCHDSKKPHSRWKVVHDASINLPGDRPITTKYKGVRWMGVEINAPALWNTPESFAEVRSVLDALRQTYWIVQGESCGVHVHIGRGEEWQSLRDLRRAAALLFATDPLLAQLHPEHRRGNEYCASNRSISCVARGMTHERARLEAEVDSYYTDEGDLEPPTMELPPESLEQFLTFDTGTSVSWSTSTPPAAATHSPNTPQLFRSPDRRISRGTLTGYKVTRPPLPTDSRNPRPAYDSWDDLSGPPCALIPCITELLSANRAGVVARLMHGSQGFGRSAYNFDNFEADTPMQYQDKATIEFRQCAASMDPDEILAFASLFLGLCHTVCTAPFASLWDVMHRCAVLERHVQNRLAVAAGKGWDESAQQVYARGGANFDVFDLLIMLGLEEEALAVQSVVLARLSSTASS
ncbi:putative amidoligase enzyme-domain-containing protein [Coniella lustricola]|uniref:Putative amidoligase enzyme-domain-containing protein n=1 Tax=Coniella lustricola TaxID=2025994 RepID=A0A2T3AG04_9PEZI|nr:putative amidoligase enzyme-domain-containing protein [Coniella lustricola]